MRDVPRREHYLHGLDRKSMKPSLAKAILTDVQFWVPAVVLAVAGAFLLTLR